ncbi:hypothetical protein [Methanobacterium oryzae]|uniref:hypothetical protein n=1 Tax=Methanobacterium oryzae TaxID=69540 RepID=UPI003D1CEF98
MNIQTLILLILILCVVGISGCTSLNTQSQKSFSDGSITFNYPGSFQNSTLPEIIMPEGWIKVATLTDEGTIIYVQKNERTGNPEEIQQAIENSIINSGFKGEILSRTKETNPNGIEISKGIYTIIDPNNNETLKYIHFYFKDKKSAAYIIRVYDYESNYNKVSDAANTIFNSLNLN